MKKTYLFLFLICLILVLVAWFILINVEKGELVKINNSELCESYNGEWLNGDCIINDQIHTIDKLEKLRINCEAMGGIWYKGKDFKCKIDGEIYSNDNLVGNNEKDLSYCYSDSDCVQMLFCGCNTIAQIAHAVNKAEENGMMYDACDHPPNSYCVCLDNKCEQLINEEVRLETIKEFTINNTLIANYPNLINYNEDEIFASENNLSDAYIISWPISLNQEILTDKNIDIINLNLPRDINMILERTEYSSDKWWGIIISDDPLFSKNDKIFFSTLNNRFLGTVMPYQIKGENYTYTITSNNIRIK